MTNIPEKTISVYITAKDTGQKVEQVDLSQLLVRNTIESPTIKLNKNGTRQEILVFGGAFTEAAASVYHKLDLEKREQIIQENGITFTYLILSIFPLIKWSSFR